MELFNQEVMLFKSADDEEGLEVACTATDDGGLVVLQESDGPLTCWSFEESPHRVEVVVGPLEVRTLMGYFHVDHAWQLLLVLRMEFTGYDCRRQICSLLRYLELPYEVVETPVER